MELSTVHDGHMSINLTHRLVYFVPEAIEEYAALGVTGQAGYFGSRAAPLGAVPDQVVVATFYNFSPGVIAGRMAKVWATTSPDAMQAARFRVVRRALHRVQAELSQDHLTEARALIDLVVEKLDLAGKPLAAANAALALPDDPQVALWQQVTVLREWRGDVHIALLLTNEIGPCECLILQVGTGRMSRFLVSSTRRWDDAEWAAATSNLVDRGWVEADGTLTDLGVRQRERIEADTDRLCAPIWTPIGDVGAARLGELLSPIHAAMDAAGTYAALA